MDPGCRTNVATLDEIVTLVRPLSLLFLGQSIPEREGETGGQGERKGKGVGEAEEDGGAGGRRERERRRRVIGGRG